MASLSYGDQICAEAPNKRTKETNFERGKIPTGLSKN